MTGVESGEVVLGVRPEHMSFSVKPSAQSLECKLLVSEMMGSELHLHLECVDGSQIIVRVPTVELSEEEMEAATVYGTTSYISFSGKVMHLFNKETGNSLLHPEFEYIVHDEEEPVEEELPLDEEIPVEEEAVEEVVEEPVQEDAPVEEEKVEE